MVTMKARLKQIDLTGQQQFRIIPSVYPPINFFEDLVHPSDMETLWEIESLTNERIRQEVGDIFLIPNEDCVVGPGSSVVMAAFTHVDYPSRFTDGSYGVYYAGLSFETAVRETVYHREHFLQATNESAGEITMRAYEGEVMKPLHDVRHQTYHHLHHPYDYTESQAFARELREAQSWGLVYNSVRHKGGECIAALRPPAISIPRQISHLKYIWNGQVITDVMDAKIILQM
jgi:hypothetical protein